MRTCLGLASGLPILLANLVTVPVFVVLFPKRPIGGESLNLNPRFSEERAASPIDSWGNCSV